MERGAVAQPERLQVRQREAAHRPGHVAQRIAARVAVGGGVVRRPDAQAVQHDDRRRADSRTRAGLDEAEAEGGERPGRAAGARRRPAGPSVLSASMPSVSISVCAIARGSPGLRSRRKSAVQSRFGLLGQTQDQRGEVLVHESLR